ncbi:hypothetical protein B0H14DRAFT_210622 [Mycena olivaceomarginata]|nr:hypothetical protein B0H14DRAFT_210622 [Mycena olivaceomarginata]
MGRRTLQLVENLVICQLSEETTAQQLLALFDTPENLRIQGSEMFYYCACAELLSATRLYSEAGEHIALIAGLFGLLKAEGLKRDDPDDPDGTQTFMNVLVSPTVRQLADATAVPPGYKHNRGALRWSRILNTSKAIPSKLTSQNTHGSMKGSYASGRLSGIWMRMGSSARMRQASGRCRFSSTRGHSCCARLKIRRVATCGKRYGRRCCTATRRWHMGSGVAIGWSGLLGSRMRRGRLRGMRGCPCCGVVALRCVFCY